MLDQDLNYVPTPNKESGIQLIRLSSVYQLLFTANKYKNEMADILEELRQLNKRIMKAYSSSSIKESALIKELLPMIMHSQEHPVSERESGAVLSQDEVIEVLKKVIPRSSELNFEEYMMAYLNLKDFEQAVQAKCTHCYPGFTPASLFALIELTKISLSKIRKYNHELDLINMRLAEIFKICSQLATHMLLNEDRSLDKLIDGFIKLAFNHPEDMDVVAYGQDLRQLVTTYHPHLMPIFSRNATIAHALTKQKALSEYDKSNEEIYGLWAAAPNQQDPCKVKHVVNSTGSCLVGDALSANKAKDSSNSQESLGGDEDLAHALEPAPASEDAVMAAMKATISCTKYGAAKDLAKVQSANKSALHGHLFTKMHAPSKHDMQHMLSDDLELILSAPYDCLYPCIEPLVDIGSLMPLIERTEQSSAYTALLFKMPNTVKSARATLKLCKVIKNNLNTLYQHLESKSC